MTIATRQLYRLLYQINRHTPEKLHLCRSCLRCAQTGSSRPFASTAFWHNVGNPSSHTQGSQPVKGTSQRNESKRTALDLSSIDTSDFLKPSTPITPRDLSPSQRADYEALPKDQQPKYLDIVNHDRALAESPAEREWLEARANALAQEFNREQTWSPTIRRAKPNEYGFWATDEDDEFGVFEDDDDVESDDQLTSIAESQLELHRDLREYTRRAAWELPLLSSMCPYELKSSFNYVIKVEATNHFALPVRNRIHKTLHATSSHKSPEI